MIYGMGIDIVRIARLSSWVGNKKKIQRFFDPREAAYILARNRQSYQIQTIASYFAVKESFGKAIGSGLRYFALRDVAVVRDNLGRPTLQLSESARSLVAHIPHCRFHISISHHEKSAVACTIIEGS